MSEKWLRRANVAEAAALLCLSWAIVRLSPFRMLAPLLGRTSPPGAEARPVIGEGDAAAARAVRGALVSAARRLPWNSTCLMRTLAGRIMLGRRGVGSVARFGVSANPDLERAHAWLIAADLDVTGGREAVDYTPIADFIRQRPLGRR